MRKGGGLGVSSELQAQWVVGSVPAKQLAWLSSAAQGAMGPQWGDSWT